MTLRKLLFVPILISLLFLIIFSDEISKSLKLLAGAITLNPKFICFLVIAILLQILGHVIRAYKTKYILEPIKKGTLRFQFRALSIGYLCNFLLPFRLGELVRAKIIASGEKISFGLALMVIIFERLLDALVLVGVGLVLWLIGKITSDASVYIWIVSFGAIIFGTILSMASLRRRTITNWVYHASALFRKSIQDNVRFKTWSVMYGMQRIFSWPRMGIYLMLTIGSWLLYLASIFLMIVLLLPNTSLEQRAVRTVAPYFGIAMPAGPASLGAYSKVTNTISESVELSRTDKVVVDLASWSVLVVPISIVGVILLAWKTKEPVRRRLLTGGSDDSLADKLSRNENISREMGSFLESFFSGNTLSQIVHRLELQKDFRLLKFFKGGSDAITVLALQNNEKVVKKIIPINLMPRLKAQYDWLDKRRNKKGIVHVLQDQKGLDFYAIDLEYDERNEMFFEFMHHNTYQESKAVLDKVWRQLHRTLYSNLEKVTDHKAVRKYIDTHILGCMEKAIAVSPDLLEASKSERIKINGKQYYNLDRVIEKITKNKKAMQDLATYSKSQEVHGDVAIDNILVSRDTQEPTLIDPAPDGNIIVGPVFDFGKNMQSLYCGYEFAVRSNDTVVLGKDGSIEYYDRMSVPYKRLCDYVRNDLSKKYLTDAERNAMIFHAGALHIRRLKHQVYQAPGLTLAIYAAGIRALNDFLALYES